MMIKHPTSVRNQMNLNILGSYLTLFTVSLYHHHSQAHLSYSSSTRLIQKGRSALLSIRQHVPNSLIWSGLTFLREEPSILMLSSVVITQCPTMMSEWKRLGILKYVSEQSTRRKQFQQLGNGALCGIGHCVRHPLLSHTELESWQNTLSISLDSLLRLMSISMIMLSFSTKLFGAALALVGTWSSWTSTNSQISDQPTWT